MIPPDSNEPSLTVVFTGSTWRWRLGMSLRAWRLRSRWIPLATLILFPFAIDRGAALLPPAEGMTRVTLWSLLAGLAAGAALVSFVALLAIARRSPDRIVTFDPQGIHERNATTNKRTNMPWAAVTTIVLGERTLALHCTQPMRTLRLTTKAASRVFVLERSSAGTAKVEALLATYAPSVRVQSS